jgi:hypothetical protein
MNGISTATASSNMGIGHSMGGIVLRQMDYRNPNYYLGGIITVGSPNKGAAIVNSIESGAVDAALNHACSSLASGPGAQLVFTPWVVRGYTREDFCEIHKNVILDQLFDLNSVPSDPGPQDLKVGSSAMNTINNFNSNIPQIAIWGNEESPVHWRLVSSMLNGNVNDQDFVEVARAVEAIYIAFEASNFAAMIVSASYAPVNPAAFTAAIYFGIASRMWGRGVRWLQTSEDTWLTVIGAAGTQTINYTIPSAVPNSGCEVYYAAYQATFFPWILSQFISCMQQCATNPGCYQTTNVTQTVTLGNASDGFIPAGSQVMDGLPQSNIYEAVGVNHREETNTSQSLPNGQDIMRITFNDIFANRDQGDFFLTPIR